MPPNLREVQPDTYIRRYTAGNAQVVFMLDVVGICKKRSCPRWAAFC